MSVLPHAKDRHTPQKQKKAGKASGLLLVATVAIAMFAMPVSSAFARTYLINGIASAIPFIGYGMRNLGKKMPGAKVFSYVTPVEASSIRKGIINDIRKRYKNNPKEKINLVGISYGAGMATRIAATLAKDNIPVNYLGIIDGGKMYAVQPNVQKLDNFTCSSADCSGKGAGLAGGNTVTKVGNFKFKDFHIGMGDNSQVHKRIISQSK